MNAQSVRHEHHGALIRIKHQGKRGAYGYGCIHPWPELGDAPLERQLEMLKQGGSSPLIRAALACSEADETTPEEDFENTLTWQRVDFTCPFSDDLAAYRIYFKTIWVPVPL